MLRRLDVRDFVLVAALELELGPGFTVLTGETGAGKSILVDALKLALGERADVSVLRPGAARAEISAEFDAPPALQDWLEAQGFEAQDTVLLRRVIDAQGRSRAFVNGSAATLAQLRAAGAMLVDIHGQHAWQSLARPDAARDLLDAHAGALVARAACHAAWQSWKELHTQLDAARADAGQLDADRALLTAQLVELERLAPQTQEWEPLNAEHHRLAHAVELVEHLQDASAQIDDDELGARTRLARAQQALTEAARIDPALAVLSEQLASVQSQVDDLAHEIAGRLRQSDLDPAKLQQVEERLSAWMTLARRHRTPPAGLPALLDALRAQRDALDRGADIPGLERALAQAQRVLHDAARQLSGLRAATAPTLARSVEALMQELGMMGGRFEIGLQALPEPQALGAEVVELLVSGHPGAEPRPLARVASGGELSRIALALAATMAVRQPVDTLIFDEVDAGIGVAVAQTVGRLLARLGAGGQVLAVTHLAQVAAHADRHLRVRKSSGADVTHSRVDDLDADARVIEVARMLGGDAESAAARSHAQELLGAARGA